MALFPPAAFVTDDTELDGVKVENVNRFDNLPDQVAIMNEM